MYFLSFILALFLSLCFVSAWPSSPYGSPHVWTRKAPARGSDSMAVTFMMPSLNQAQLDSLLESVSDPLSSKFAQYSTLDDLAALTADRQAIASVTQWIESHGGLAEVARSGDFISTSFPVRVVEALFATRVHTYAHANTGALINRASKYTLPKEIADSVLFVTNINHFPNPARRPSFASYRVPALPNAPVGPVPANTATPQLFMSVYGIDNPTIASPKATQAVFESGQYWDYADLASYFETFNLDLKINISKTIGVNTPGACANGDPNFACGESNLDIQVLMATAQQARTDFYSINTKDEQPFVDFLRVLANDPDAPLVNSVSYGEQENFVPANITTAFNTVIQKIGARGITVLIASGDSGVTGALANGSFACGFFPDYPASSPYVTAVGATQGPESGMPEVGCSTNTGAVITSGGGFSNVWPAPSYQQALVAAFLKNPKTPPASAGYNPNGRGYPDVALLGHAYPIVDGQSLLVVDGTSASTPLFAGMLSLINGLRLAAGKGPIGFANPALYNFKVSQPSVFNDITSGENNCGEAGQQGFTCCTSGFSAVAGWSAMTGLGSVNFQALKKAYMALP